MNLIRIRRMRSLENDEKVEELTGLSENRWVEGNIKNFDFLISRDFCLDGVLWFDGLEEVLG
jgi:hypothetical protein